jgi:hypothetical protein
MDGSLDGASDEYRSQLVKNQTEERLAKLRGRLVEERVPDPDAPGADDLGTGDAVPVNGKDEPQDHDEDGDAAEDIPAANGTRPYPAAVVREKVAALVAKNKGARRDAKIGNMEAWNYARWMLRECFAGDPKHEEYAHSVSAYLLGKDTANDWTGADALAIIKWLDPKEDAAGDLKPHKDSRMEARFCLKARMADLGQTELPMEANDG